MSKQIPLAQILAEDGLLPQLTTAAELATTSAAAVDEVPINPQLPMPMLAKMPQQSAEPLGPDLLLKLCALGLGALAVAAGAFGLWLHRPVQAQAQSQLIRDMANVMVAQQSQVEAAIATAQPPQYKCNALFGGCHFPEQQPRHIAQAPAVSQASSQTPTDRFELPDSLAGQTGHSAEQPSQFEVHSAKTHLIDWNAQGVDLTTVALYITQLRDQPDPTMPSPIAFEAAFTALYGDSI